MSTDGVRRIELSQGFVTVIDADDWDREFTVEFSRGLWWSGRICDRPWKALPKSHTTYASCTLAGNLDLRLHRVICNARLSECIDHIDHDGLNNRRSNLRLVTWASNAQNRQRNAGRELPKGVCFHKDSGKFEAYIRHGGRKIHLGLFPDYETAGRAYDRKATELFGEFAQTNY